ncbi:MAG: tRNA 2-thiouridine(34) synthase MnmA [Puniceicoccales bacterium]|nr:tRNA 2-thiouridine(34) synthase MnmA [Puniceicoccales bacterium]
MATARQKYPLHLGAEKLRLCVAISGGVDSAVAAFLAKKSFPAAEAVHMRTWHSEDKLGHCPWRDDLESAKAVSDHLSIPFRVESMIEHYRRHVVSALVDGYGAGRTPNPDMLCNRHVKFGELLRRAMAGGCNFLATGHYCQIRKLKGGEFSLERGADPTKDQSYFMAAVDAAVLPFIIFPVGGLSKKCVREIAKEIGLPNAKRKDSQDICFLGGKISLQDFLSGHIGDRPGDIVSTDGKVIGRHGGIFRYTVGQRRGLAIPSNADFEKYVVVEKDCANNRIVVAFESDKNSGLRRSLVELENVNFLSKPMVGKVNLLAETRFRDPPTAATVTFRGDGTALVRFEEEQRALAEGQTMAFYDGNRLLGGGIYAKAQ